MWLGHTILPHTFKPLHNGTPSVDSEPCPGIITWITVCQDWCVCEMYIQAHVWNTIQRQDTSEAEIQRLKWLRYINVQALVDIIHFGTSVVDHQSTSRSSLRSGSHQRPKSRKRRTYSAFFAYHTSGKSSAYPISSKNLRIYTFCLCVILSISRFE